MWQNLVALSGMEVFKDVMDSLTRNEAAWRAWYDAEAPCQTAIPEYENRLNKFQRMCIVKVGIVNGKKLTKSGSYEKLTSLHVLASVFIIFRQYGKIKHLLLQPTTLVRS
jgi:hypothetical protein